MTIAHLNKYWHVWAHASAITCHIYIDRPETQGILWSKACERFFLMGLLQ